MLLTSESVFLMTTTTMHCRAPSSIRFVPTPPIPPQQFERRCNCAAVAVVLVLALTGTSPSRPCHPRHRIAIALTITSLSLLPPRRSPSHHHCPRHCVAIALTLTGTDVPGTFLSPSPLHRRHPHPTVHPLATLRLASPRPHPSTLSHPRFTL